MHRLLMHDDDLAWPMCMYCVKEKELGRSVSAALALWKRPRPSELVGAEYHGATVFPLLGGRACVEMICPPTTTSHHTAGFDMARALDARYHHHLSPPALTLPTHRHGRHFLLAFPSYRAGQVRLLR